MKRACFVVDGFNLYFSLRRASTQLGLGGAGTRWLDLRKFCNTQAQIVRRALDHNERIEVGGIYYYTALPNHLAAIQPETYQRHMTYIECLQSCGVTVGFGNFHMKPVYCPNCNSEFEIPEEKETDLNVGISIADLAVNQLCDVIVVVSGDSDISPAVRWAKDNNDQIKIVAMFPFGRGSDELRKVCDYDFKIAAKSYTNCQFPDPYITPERRSISKPLRW